DLPRTRVESLRIRRGGEDAVWKSGTNARDLGNSKTAPLPVGINHETMPLIEVSASAIAPAIVGRGKSSAVWGGLRLSRSGSDVDEFQIEKISGQRIALQVDRMTPGIGGLQKAAAQAPSGHKVEGIVIG